MPRPLRVLHAEGVYHVYARGNERREIYRDEIDRQAYLKLLGRVVQKRSWRVMAFCLMPNHVHLLVETPRPDLSEGMQRLHGPYAQLFNARHDRVGHLFQGRFGAVRVVTDAQLVTVVGYIAVNPVAAGLCRDPGEWAWSSHRYVSGLSTGPRWLDVPRLMWRLSGTGAEPLSRYRDIVDERLRVAYPGGVRPLECE